MTRFIIISLPPPAISHPLEEIRLRLAELTGAREALRYPVHITLRTGALVPEESVQSFWEGWQAHISRPDSPPLPAFETVGLLYEDSFVGYLAKTTAQVMAYHKYLLSYDPWIKSLQTAYFPHLSLAYGDLPPGGTEECRKWLEGQRLASKNWRWRCQEPELFVEADGIWKKFSG